MTPQEFVDAARAHHMRLIDVLNFEALAHLSRDRMVPNCDRWLREHRDPAWPDDVLDALVDTVLDNIFGLGPLEPLLRDEQVTLIEVDGPDRIRAERAGDEVWSIVPWYDTATLALTLERITGAIEARPIGPTNPRVEGVLVDGSRFEAAVPPAVPRPFLRIVR